jgi:hypothetical protein
MIDTCFGIKRRDFITLLGATALRWLSLVQAQ